MIFIHQPFKLVLQIPIRLRWRTRRNIRIPSVRCPKLLIRAIRLLAFPIDRLRIIASLRVFPQLSLNFLLLHKRPRNLIFSMPARLRAERSVFLHDNRRILRRLLIKFRWRFPLKRAFLLFPERHFHRPGAAARRPREARKAARHDAHRALHRDDGDVYVLVVF